MDLVDIGYKVIGAEKFLVKVAEILLGFWYVCLFFLIIASIAEKAPLVTKKRNMVLVKIIAATLYGWLGIPLLLMVRVGLQRFHVFQWFSVHFMIIMLTVIAIGILLLYSGTLVTLFQDEVEYSWPLKSFNHKESKEISAGDRTCLCRE